MTYSVQVRKLALRMVKTIGVVKTSASTKISRSSLWRWKRYGVDPKKRLHESKLFERTRAMLGDFLYSNPCSTARDVAKHFRQFQGIPISTKTILKFIKKAGFSRKRTRTRGRCKGDLGALITAFRGKYKTAAHDGKTLVSIDECGFSEKLKPFYGYSPVGQPVIVKSCGGWVHHSLLMAVFSDGRKAFSIQKGAIKRIDFCQFIDSMDLDDNNVVVMDNASIHKNLTLTTRPQICYTPPYSPEFNAIELCFAKVKGAFRKLNMIENSGVQTMVANAVHELSPAMIVACFEHVTTNFMA